MWVRFVHELHSSPFTSEDQSMSGSRVIACRTLSDWRYHVQWSPADSDSSADESKNIASPGFLLQWLIWLYYSEFTFWGIAKGKS